MILSQHLPWRNLWKTVARWWCRRRKRWLFSSSKILRRWSGRSLLSHSKSSSQPHTRILDSSIFSHTAEASGYFCHTSWWDPSSGTSSPRSLSLPSLVISCSIDWATTVFKHRVREPRSMWGRVKYSSQESISIARERKSFLKVLRNWAWIAMKCPNRLTKMTCHKTPNSISSKIITKVEAQLIWSMKVARVSSIHSIALWPETSEVSMSSALTVNKDLKLSKMLL